MEFPSPILNKIRLIHLPTLCEISDEENWSLVKSGQMPVYVVSLNDYCYPEFTTIAQPQT